MKAKRCSICHKEFPSLWRSKPPSCQQCTMREKASQRGYKVPIKQKQRINSISDKQAKLNKAYSVLATQFKKDNPYCQVKQQCQGAPISDVHHKKGRGKHLLDSSTWLATCRKCHTWLHDNDAEAREKGFIQSRLTKE